MTAETFATPPLAHKGDARGPSRFALLGADVTEEPETELAVSGRLPDELSGVLYRNGPGQFSRGKARKRTLLDGDGVVQKLAINGGTARYARRFVRTPKLEQENRAGKFLSPTWTSTAPGILTNLGQRLQTQAGVTIYETGGRLLALDEVAPGYELDPVTLATKAPAELGMPESDRGMKAHARRISGTGDWIFASTRMGRHGMFIDIVRHRADGTRIATPTVAAPRMTYVHDFVATERYALFILHAARVHGLRYMLGLAAFTECLEWQPEEGNLVVLIDLSNGQKKVFEAPAAWVWHFANGYESGSVFIADFVGYDVPGHFLGEHAQLAAIMQGEEGDPGSNGTLRRYTIDLDRGKLEETILNPGNFDFCSSDARLSGQAHSVVYATHQSAPGILHSGIAAVNTRTGHVDAFDFGADVNAGEPVFAPEPGQGTDQGWLITQTFDARKAESGFAVFDVRHINDGPVASVTLPSRMAMSFHGHWIAS